MSENKIRVHIGTGLPDGSPTTPKGDFARIDGDDIILPNGYRIFVDTEFCEEDTKEINAAHAKDKATAVAEAYEKLIEKIGNNGHRIDCSCLDCVAIGRFAEIVRKLAEEARNGI